VNDDDEKKESDCTLNRFTVIRLIKVTFRVMQRKGKDNSKGLRSYWNSGSIRWIIIIRSKTTAYIRMRENLCQMVKMKYQRPGNTSVYR
jgi:hypothetical protein